MKKTLLTFGLLLITILTFGQQTKYVDTEELNIRAGAGTKYEVVDKISQGQKVTVLTEQGKWSEIELENGTKGFVSTKFLSETETSSSSKKSEKKNGVERESLDAIFESCSFFAAASNFSQRDSRDESKTFLITLPPH